MPDTDGDLVTYNLDELLKACPEESLTLNEEDVAWLSDEPVNGDDSIEE